MAAYIIIPLYMMLIRPTGLTLVEIIILLNCAHGSEANKAYYHQNKRILNLTAIMKEVYGFSEERKKSVRSKSDLHLL